MYIDNPIVSQTRLLRNHDRSKKWKSEGSSERRHLKRPHSDSSDIELKSKTPTRLNVKGQKDGINHINKVIRKEEDGYRTSGEAQHRKDKSSVEFGTDDQDYLFNELARILYRVNTILMILFDNSEAGRGKIKPNADDSSQKEDDLGLNRLELAEFTNESWQQYESKNKLWREILKDSGLVCGVASTSLESVLDLIELAAINNLPVLLLGETGTGKELVAKAIHETSQRKDQALIKVNCAAIQPNLIESEFFGHVRGAFTGANVNREGRFRKADRGTIFLDEIGELPAHLQVKLLRVLNENEFEPVGSSQTSKINVRVVSATNANIEKMRNEGGFRNDLYYRLNVFTIKLPPLRERPWDIPALVQYFSNCCAIEKNGRKVPYDQKLFKAIIWHEWQGNVRQLENFIKLTQELPRNKICLEDIKLIHTDPSYYQLEIAYRQYEEYSEWAKLILKLSDIAAKMFTETWEVLENAWEKWQNKRTVSSSNLEQEKEIFYRELDPRDSQRLKEIVQDTWKEFRRFLKAEGYSGIQDSNCYVMLMSCYGSKHNVKNIEKAVKWTLKSVLEKLKEMKLDLSNQYEIENYDRFKEFFGKTYRTVRDWKENKF